MDGAWQKEPLLPQLGLKFTILKPVSVAEDATFS
uniref:Uncharacterized protein n=1 Tax=Arundo donax TaxID=35708 RepID=A0A0A9H0I5_ARUDO